MLKKSGFWNFESSCKLDVLTDKHQPIIIRALQDVETRIESQDRDYILYNKADALLVKTRSYFVYYSIMLIRGLQFSLARQL